MQPRKWLGSVMSFIILCFIILLVATDWVVAQSQSAARGRPPRGEKQLLYIPSSGTGGGGAQNGHGILAFDVRNNFRFVKRIPTWDMKAWQNPDDDEVKGLEVSAETGLLYLATFTGLAAFDLVTEKQVWQQTYDGNCCDRLSLSPDSKILYVPQVGPVREEGSDGWLVVDAITGKMLKKIDTPQSRGTHNTIYSPDGTKVFMGGVNGRYVSVADTKTHTVMQTVGPFSDVIRPFTINGSGTLVFVNVGLGAAVGRESGMVLGFEVGDVRTGKMIHRVEVPGYGWTRDRIRVEGTPSHGIAMSPDEKEIWVTDGVHGVLHVFDSTLMPPKWMTAVTLVRRAGLGEDDRHDYPDWVTFGLDGKYVYASTGDVIEAATKEVVASLTDEYGRSVRSQKMVEVLFRDGKPVRVSDQFGYGHVTRPTN